MSSPASGKNRLPPNVQLPRHPVKQQQQQQQRQQSTVALASTPQKICFVSMPNGPSTTQLSGGAVVTVANSSATTSISALLPTMPVPPPTTSQQTHIAVAPAPTAPVAGLSKIINSANKIISSNGVTTHVNIPGMPNTSITSVPTPSSSSGGVGGSAAGGQCNAQIVTSSLRELRMKGSAFLRTHASKHGITNASRKLTAVVIDELTQHYADVHGVKMIPEESEPSVVVTTLPPKPTSTTAFPSAPPPKESPGLPCPIGVAQILQSMKDPARAPPPPPPSTVVQARPQQQQQQQEQQRQLPNAVVPCLPQYPVPPKQLTQETVGAVTIKKITPSASATLPTSATKQPISSTTRCPSAVNTSIAAVAAAAAAVAASSSTSPTSTSVGGVCSVPVLAKTRVDLSACGTSMLRPEAAAHKVHNASRKPKDKVVEELWQHYVQCHAKDLKSKEPAAAKGRPYPLVNGRAAAVAPPTSTLKSVSNGVVKTVIEASGRAGATGKGTAAAEATNVVGGQWVGDVHDDDDN